MPGCVYQACAGTALLSQAQKAQGFRIPLKSPHSSSVSLRDAAICLASGSESDPWKEKVAGGNCAFLACHVPAVVVHLLRIFRAPRPGYRTLFRGAWLM